MDKKAVLIPTATSVFLGPSLILILEEGIVST
jgi:hypothetical protein